MADLEKVATTVLEILLAALATTNQCVISYIPNSRVPRLGKLNTALIVPFMIYKLTMGKLCICLFPPVFLYLSFLDYIGLTSIIVWDLWGFYCNHLYHFQLVDT